MSTHDFEVGTILYSSWGYEQTNVDFYKVLKRTKTQVTFRQMGVISTPEENMSGTVQPLKGQWKSEKIFRRKVIQNKFVKIEDFMYGRKWDGTPKRFSTYG